MKREDYNSGTASGYASGYNSGSVSGYGSVSGSGSTLGSVTTRRFVTMPGSAYPHPTQATISSDSIPNNGLTTDFSISLLTPTLFALSPTIPVLMATPEAIKFDSIELGRERVDLLFNSSMSSNQTAHSSN